MTISPRKVRHISPSQDVCLCLPAKYLHIDIFEIVRNFKIFASHYFTCSVLVKFLPCLVTTRCSALGEEAGDSGVPTKGCIGGRRNSRLED